MKILTTDEKATTLHNLQSKTDYVGECWLYRGFEYGNFYVGLYILGKRTMAHRASASIFLGLDLDNDKVQVNHKPECRNKHCWKPEHLYIGTQADNMKDLNTISLKENRTCKICGCLRTKVRTKNRNGEFKYRLDCNNCKMRRYRAKKNG